MIVQFKYHTSNQVHATHDDVTGVYNGVLPLALGNPGSTTLLGYREEFFWVGAAEYKKGVDSNNHTMLSDGSARYPKASFHLGHEKDVTTRLHHKRKNATTPFQIQWYGFEILPG